MNPPIVPVAAACAAVCLSVLSSCSERTKAEAADSDAPAKHVLLLSLDTLRADHTGFGGYAKDTTPFLDSLAARGVVFDDHRSNSNCTLPSHASMLTGLLPPSHGVRISMNVGETLHVLAPSVTTIAERYRDAGYRTTAVTSHAAWLNEAYGFDQGFDNFQTHWQMADETIEQYLELLDAEPDTRSFTFLHFFDIHSDGAGSNPRIAYKADPELIAKFAGDMPKGFMDSSVDPSMSGSVWLGSLEGEDALNEAERTFIEGLYDAGVAQLDRDLRGLFEGLEERGVLQDMMIVITSDHGEGFGEHGKYLHDGFHSEVSHVPLIIVPPARFGVAPHRVSARTQSTDLAPTLLELSRLEPIGETRSLADAVMFGGDPEDSQAMFLHRVLIGSDAEGDFLLVRDPKRPQFFDTKLDPTESTDFALDPAYRAAHDTRLRAALGLLDGMIDRGKLHFATIEADALRAATSSSLDEAAESELQDLGYL